MCLGAIYWAHLDRMYYGNNKHDAAAIGFDDAFIYEELDLKPAERRLPSEVLLPEEAIKAFQDWTAKGGILKMIRQGGGSVLSFFRFPLAEPYVSLGGNLRLRQGKRMFYGRET